MSQFDKALDDARQMLRTFRAFQQVETVLAQAVEAAKVLDELDARRVKLQTDIESLREVHAQEQERLEKATAEAQAQHAREVAALQARHAEMSQSSHGVLDALHRQHEEMLTAHDITAAELNEKRVLAQAELEATTLKLERAKAELSGLMARIGLA